MATNSKKVIHIRLSRQSRDLRVISGAPLPEGGWIHAIRGGLNMSLRQLGARLGMTAAGAKQMELRERDGSITLKSLREAATAMNAKFVYALVTEESIEDMIDKRARELAAEIVGRASTTMILEDQKTSQKRLEKAITERAEKIKAETPNLLWD